MITDGFMALFYPHDVFFTLGKSESRMLFHVSKGGTIILGKSNAAGSEIPN